MKLPNGYGSVHKLTGKRRNPFRVRKTNGWKWYDHLNQCFLDKEPKEAMEKLDDGTFRFQSKQQFITVGYYETKKEALQALAAYNEDPYDLHLNTITFEEVYEKWSDKHFPTVSESNVKGYKASFKLCDSIKDMTFQDIKLDHLQRIVDESGKNTPTLRKLKVMFGLMYDYAVMHEIVKQDKREMVRYVDINKAGNPNAMDRKPFKMKEVKEVWKTKDSNEYMSVVLMLIYSGVRISELLDLEKKDVHVEERWFYVKEAKTKAGIREVPIAEKIVPFFEHWMKQPGDYLLNTPDGQHFEYRNFYDSYWKPMMDILGYEYTPHCTRHTCVSMLTAAGVDDRIIKKIVGHKGQGVTEAVYTHLELPIKLEAINKI